MGKLYLNNFSEVNLYNKMSSKSEVTTQMIYGDAFYIINKKKNWLKIKIKKDGYVGFVKKRNYHNYKKPSHKVSVIFAKTYKKPNFRHLSGKLTFGAEVKSERKINGFINFDKKWINLKDLKPIKFKNKDIFSNIKIFKNVKYKWGGKSFRGVDCSALLQIFLNFNNKFCPRDAKDQVKYFKKNVKLDNIKKNDIIFWKGHVALALSNKKLIHAYGPMRKTVIMDIDKTIKRIEQTAKLKVTGIKRL